MSPFSSSPLTRRSSQWRQLATQKNDRLYARVTGDLPEGSHMKVDV